MFFRKPRSAFTTKGRLSLTDVETAEQTLAERELSSALPVAAYREIIRCALRRMQRDLDSGSGDEVVEESQREILYRQWCAANERSDPAQSALPPRRRRNSL
jgi:hypothetical protein